MKIERHIDNLGRIVLPIQFRRRLGLKTNSKVTVQLENGTVIITPISAQCCLCGKRLDCENELKLCKSCLKRAKKLT